MECVARLLARFLKEKRTVNVILHEDEHLFKLLVFAGAISASQRGCEPPFSDHLQHPLALSLSPSPLSYPLAPPSSPSLSQTQTAEPVSPWAWDGWLWAVPKKRTSHSKKRMRMTHKYLKPRHHYTVCPSCNNLKLLHVLCGHCLKETLKQTAAMRRTQMEQQLVERRETENCDYVETGSSSR